jgi:hypothetical protein
MKPHRAVALLLVFSAAMLLHAKDKKPSVPAVFGQARYVYVEAMDGQEFDPNLYPEDRMAIADVRDALEHWHRYILTTQRDQADLVIVVRRGRAASADVGLRPTPAGRGQVGAGQPQAGGPIGGASSGSMGGPGIEVGGEAGPADDLFEVCQVNESGKRSGPLWERTMPEGLSAPRVMLLQQFKDAVEKAYPSQPPPQGQAKKP